MESKRTRGWCFTVQLSDDLAQQDHDDLAIDVSAMFEHDLNCKYLIIGWERGGRTGNKHLQCYVYFTNPVEFKYIKSWVHIAHIEPQKAKRNVEAYAYCMEDRDFIEFGDRPRQGHRTDLEVIKHDILRGKSEKDISMNYFSQWCQYRRAFYEFRHIHREKHDTKIVAYDIDELHNSFPIVFHRLDNDLDLLVRGLYDMSELEIMACYYSKRYRYIFYPVSKNLQVPYYIHRLIHEIISEDKITIEKISHSNLEQWHENTKGKKVEDVEIVETDGETTVED